MLTRTYHPPGGGGVAIHVKYLSEALASLTNNPYQKRKTCAVRVVTSGDHSEGKARSLLIRRVGGKGGHFPLDGDIPLGNMFESLLAELPALKPDIIHAHDFESIYIAMLLKALFQIPLVVTIHKTPKEYDWTSPQRDAKDAFLNMMKKYNVADYFVAPSRSYFLRLQSEGFKNIEVIHHGIPVVKLSSTRNDPAVLADFRLKEEHNVILCPARLDPHKGVDLLIEAAAILRRSYKNLVFVVTGSGSPDYRQKLSRLARAEGVEDIVRLGPTTGVDVPHNQMPTLYRRASVCVLPSKRDGFPQAVLESYAFKKPVVGANTGGIPEMIHPGSTGFLFHRDDPNDLARQIGTLVNNRYQAKEFGEEGFKKVTLQFNSLRMAEEHFDLYKKITGAIIK